MNNFAQRNQPETHTHTRNILWKHVFRNILTFTHQGFMSGVCDEHDHLEFGRTPQTHPYIKQFIWKQYCFLHTLETLCELVRWCPEFVDFADFRISRTLEFLNSVISGFLDLGMWAFQDFTSFRFQDFKRSGLLNFWVLRFLEVGISVCWGFWIWGFTDFKILEFWFSGFQNFWVSGFLDFWITGIQDFRI